MRILLVHYDELDALGGVELLIRQLAEAFTKAGHPTGVIEMGTCWRGRRTLTGGIPIWTVAAASFPQWTRPRSWASVTRSALHLGRVIREWGAEIVHVHFPIGQSVPVVCAHAFPHRWRLAVTVHNSEIRVAPRSDPDVALWQRRLFARADAVSAVSRSMLMDTCSQYSGVMDKGCVIYNGIGEYWFEDQGRERPQSHTNQSSARPYVLFAGRLHPMKGADILLRAWVDVIREAPGRELRLAGDGPERATLKRMVQELGLSESVRFLGAIDNRELKPLYANAEAVVLPSRAEGFPLTLLEASACGSICVGSDVPGIAEIIDDGTTGFLFPTESVVGLSQRLISVLHLGTEETGRIRNSAYKKVRKHFTRQKMVEDYLQFYRRLQ